MRWHGMAWHTQQTHARTHARTHADRQTHSVKDGQPLPRCLRSCCIPSCPSLISSLLPARSIGPPHSYLCCHHHHRHRHRHLRTHYTDRLARIPGQHISLLPLATAKVKVRGVSPDAPFFLLLAFAKLEQRTLAHAKAPHHTTSTVSGHITWTRFLSSHLGLGNFGASVNVCGSRVVISISVVLLSRYSLSRIQYSKAQDNTVQYSAFISVNRTALIGVRRASSSRHQLSPLPVSPPGTRHCQP